ncbi:MAG: hypothetical protein ACTHNW_13670 [Mucilaginibacter sp.]
MKKLLFVAALGVGVASSVFAANAKSNIGSFSSKQLAVSGNVVPVSFSEVVSSSTTTTTTTTTTKTNTTTTKTSGSFAE